MSETSYSDLIRTGAEQLRQAGLSDPVREARRLIELATGYSPSSLIARETDPALAEHVSVFDDLLKRRSARAPFAHLKGQVSFYGLDLKSDARALIPRPDSETVVELALNLIPEDATWQVADLGTGSGALLAALLANRSKVKGVGVERNSDAFQLASENISALGLSAQADMFQGSWAEWTAWDTCDLIISNPPYIERRVIEGLQPEVRNHDPLDALDGGEDGLQAYREIITLGAQKMRPGAHLVLEIGFDQKSSVLALLEAAGFSDLTHKQDLGGNDRAIAATKT